VNSVRFAELNIKIVPSKNAPRLTFAQLITLSAAQKNWENRAPSTRIRWLIILGVLILAAAIFGGVIAS